MNRHFSRDRQQLPKTRHLFGAAAAFTVILGLHGGASAHGRDPTPSDPALREQYRAGLAAFYNQDYSTALKILRPIAESNKGSSAAQLFLGLMYAGGLGVTQDIGRAAEWYLRAADQDDPLGQMRLALIYRAGAGISPDLVKAHMWASLAARQRGHMRGPANALKAALGEEMTADEVRWSDTLAEAWKSRHAGSD